MSRVIYITRLLRMRLSNILKASSDPPSSIFLMIMPGHKTATFVSDCKYEIFINGYVYLCQSNSLLNIRQI